MRKQDRCLIIIGGHEDKEGDKRILKEVARRVGRGKLVVATVASEEPRELWETYERVFRNLGVRHVFHLDVESRADAVDEARAKIFEDATAVFFTGGDQLKITSQIGDTPIYRCIVDLYEAGGTICGTSAGASAMSETMLVSGNGEQSHRIGGALHMAPGLGLLPDVIIDQHFAERGRLGRLLGAVAQNPRILGVGIDEDTSIVVEGARRFEVLGEGAVYILDGRTVTYSNLAEEEVDHAMSIYDIRLHLLSEPDRFDLRERRPVKHSVDEALEVMEEESKIRPGV
jgi:cyanophycinase